MNFVAGLWADLLDIGPTVLGLAWFAYLVVLSCWIVLRKREPDLDEAAASFRRASRSRP